MNKHHLHPDDRALQQFLNNACSELELKKIGRHIQSCPVCRTRLRAYLDMESLLDSLPLLHASPGLEDRVMQAIAAPPRAASGQPEARPASARKPRWRAELLHGLVAAAATYLFVSSGVLGKIISINAEQWGADVQSKVAAVEWIVQRLSS
ncbi:anti-sigma factor [Paenibacillus doosanensis]|uniref:Zinc-finger domain-containing protein n=1 Tax=Paenibacillus konkukensis TaxID=2020716 RepID=A0ABY4RME8_9BACL|nr:MULTISPECIES: anti-sigma factor [Paenibacillus]MCS7461380.1 anti-sigma factor [Paenibacillus doosanensis]UQZ83649.1 hypothetical protein SK3146_02856 [Paenibacillus konkukensis]